MLVLVVCISAPALSISGQDDEEKAGQVEDDKDRAQEPLPPEKHFKLALTKQRLIISSNRHILRILRAHNNDPMSAMRDLKIHYQERAAMLDKLYRSCGVSPVFYRHSNPGESVQRQRAEYLDQKPGVREELAKNSNKIRSQEREVWLSMSRLWTGTRVRHRN